MDAQTLWSHFAVDQKFWLPNFPEFLETNYPSLMNQYEEFWNNLGDSKETPFYILQEIGAYLRESWFEDKSYEELFLEMVQYDKTPYTTCWGCITLNQNQLAHMDVGGCLYEDDD